MKVYEINRWKYSSKDRIGSGGQGIVYICRHENYKEDHAIKVFLLKRITNNKKKRKKLLRISDEIRALKSINHENIIKLVDSGYVERGDLYYIVMKKADTSLKEYIHKEKLTFRNKINIFKQIIEGIKATHAHEPIIIHRDLKPANILIKKGKIKISDFGISFFLEDRNEKRVTSINEIVGSRNWRSPQTELGRQTNPTVKEDFYLMGKLLYFLLADGKELYREYFNSEEFFLPYIHKDPKYIVFNDFFNWTIATNRRDIFDNINTLSEVFEKASKLYLYFSIDEEVDELIRLAHVFHMKRMYKEYAEVLYKAFNLNKNNYYAQYFYGRLLLRKNKKEEGWKLLHKVVNSKITDYLILAQLSSLLYHRGNLELSEKIRQKSMILKKKDIPIKILNGNSEANRKYLKYSTLGRQREV